MPGVEVVEGEVGLVEAAEIVAVRGVVLPPLLHQRLRVVDFSRCEQVIDLSAQLSQSPFLNLLSDHRVRETMKLMGRAPGDPLTPEVAREICVRSSSKVMLTGSISSLGSQYVIGLKAVNCNSGEVLAQEQVQAAAKEEVLKLLSQETTKLRQKLGESLSSIRRFDVPLYQVTTPSLDALKAFSTADIARAERGDDAAVPFLRRAIELDPNFAMAHALLGTLYSNLQEPACRWKA